MFHNFIIPTTQVTLGVLEQAKASGVPALWIQPGAEDAAVIKYIEENGLQDKVIYGGACVMTEGDDVLLLLPEPDDLNGVIGTSKWMVRQATAELLDRTGATGGESAVEIAGPTNEVVQGAGDNGVGGGCSGASCGDSRLEW